MPKKVVCFGEMLWDCFPDYEIAGGAPMNVALNLHQLGLEVKMISRVGKDEPGYKLKDFVKDYGLPLDLIQDDSEHSTGKVVVDDTDNENIRYEIIAPVAWDFISFSEGNQKAVNEADAFIYGSLAVRHNQSWDTLQRLLNTSALKIFDINLRAPFCDFEKIETILGFTDILKINEDELQVLADHFEILLDIKSFWCFKSSKVPAAIKNLCLTLSKSFSLQMICITFGSKGAMIYQNEQFFCHFGYKVQVKDTVGSGDAFLSGFVKNYLEGKSLTESLDFGCALGAFVATHVGGTPKYEVEELIDWISRSR